MLELYLIKINYIWVIQKMFTLQMFILKHTYINGILPNVSLVAAQVLDLKARTTAQHISLLKGRQSTKIYTLIKSFPWISMKFPNNNGIDFWKTYWSLKLKIHNSLFKFKFSSNSWHVILARKCFIWNKLIMNLARPGVYSVEYALLCNHIIKEICTEEKNKSIIDSWES